MSEKPNCLHSLALKCAGVLAVALSATSRLASAEDVGTAFTYQGELTQAGQPVDDTECSFLLRLYDDPQSGSALGEVVESTVVSSGRFTVRPDFGTSVSVEDQALWLEIGVCCADDLEDCLVPVSYAILSPRQRRVIATPFALKARGIVLDHSENVGIGTSEPQADLHVRGNSPWGESIVWPGQADASAQMRITEDTSDSLSTIMSYDGTDYQWQAPGLFFGEAAPHLIIERDRGDLGIGTINPQAKLHIDGNLWIDGAPIRSPQAGGLVTVFIDPWDWRCQSPDFTSRQHPGRLRLLGPAADGERWQAPVAAPTGAQLWFFTACVDCAVVGFGGEVQLMKYSYAGEYPDTSMEVVSIGPLCPQEKECVSRIFLSTLEANEIWYVQATPPGDDLPGFDGIRLLSVRVSYQYPPP